MRAFLRRYLLRLENSRHYAPEQGLPLMIEFRQKVDSLNCVVKNFRITELAIELDLFATDQSSKQSAVKLLSDQYGKLLSERDLSEDAPSVVQDKESIVRESASLFNEQRYWECHETLEQIWRKEKDPVEKAVLQGVILAASALVHAQKSENEVCLGMIPRALEKLGRWEEPTYYSIDVKQLVDALRRMLETRRIEYVKLRDL